MKNILTMLLIVFVMFVQNRLGKSQDEKQISETSQSVDSILKTSDSLYNDIINRLESCKKDTMSIFETTQGGLVTGYFDDEKLRLMRIKYYGEMGRRVLDFLFLDGEVIYIEDILIDYNVIIYMEGSKIVKVSKHRYYFKNNNLLKCIDAKGEVVAEDYCAKQIELFNEEIEKYSKVLKPD